MLSNERQLETLISENGEASEQMICAISGWAMMEVNEYENPRILSARADPVYFVALIKS